MIFEGFVRAESYDLSIESPGVASAISLHFGISSIVRRSATPPKVSCVAAGAVALMGGQGQCRASIDAAGADQVFP